MKRISQRTFDQAGVIILDNGRVVPFYKGESPISISVLRIKNDEINITAIFECFDPISHSINNYKVKFPMLSDMWEIRTGFKDVARFGYNAFIDKGVYC